MGIYIEHGVEYRVVLKDGSFIKIATTRDTDERLTQSQYFNDNKKTWFNNHTSFAKLLAHTADLELYNNEHTNLQKEIEQHGDDVDHHGWYEVNYTSTTH